MINCENLGCWLWIGETDISVTVGFLCVLNDKL